MRHPVPDPVAGRGILLRQFASSQGDHQTCQDFFASLWCVNWAQTTTESSSIRTAFVARAFEFVVPVLCQTSENLWFNLTDGTDILMSTIRNVVRGGKGTSVANFSRQMTSHSSPSHHRSQGYRTGQTQKAQTSRTLRHRKRHEVFEFPRSGPRSWRSIRSCEFAVKLKGSVTRLTTVQEGPQYEARHQRTL